MFDKATISNLVIQLIEIQKVTKSQMGKPEI